MGEITFGVWDWISNFIPHIILNELLIHVGIKGLIMDRCVLLTPTPECVVSPRRAIMVLAISIRINQYSAY